MLIIDALEILYYFMRKAFLSTFWRIKSYLENIMKTWRTKKMMRRNRNLRNLLTRIWCNHFLKGREMLWIGRGRIRRRESLIVIWSCLTLCWRVLNRISIWNKAKWWPQPFWMEQILSISGRRKGNRSNRVTILMMFVTNSKS